MNIFNRKIKQKHLELFAIKIAELLETELPQLKKAIGISRIAGISFMQKPSAIFILRGYNPKEFEEINRNHKTCFNLTGISVWNRKTENFELLKLNYQHDTLTKIEIANPEYFHKTFDLNRIQKSEIKLDHLKMENPDQKIAEKALKTLTKEQLKLLELDYTFEIELDEKLFYTILDMEDGNYVAVDKKGKIYRLNHDHEERVKLISNKPTDFFKIYNGEKDELENIMN
ncbi:MULTISPECIES: hypothetical protein [Tenacibaculum]|uniref:hypothetical protein n=1 Tax=Tenacibaculum TaxID=104267 RepID=UPI001F0A72C4|nr:MULTISPECIES: hypothetical protein [Tenacibaculum]MCH3882922.1 hypothetical protein [Tenacibaculum aquimarinum]MDO6600817.1 hypothetical protein [Tenacibaculum sp. 1_MG-2023]